MIKTSFLAVLFLIGISLIAPDAMAQVNPSNEAQPQQENRTPGNQPQDIRANVLRQLGLSREQIQQIRRINVERRPLMEGAQQRLKDATQALDAAIYADQINEVDVRDRLKDVQLAQAEVAKVRFMNEVAVRRILTPEQLIRFRELRERFERIRETIEDRRKVDRQLPPSDGQPAGNERKQEKKFLREPLTRPVT